MRLALPDLYQEEQVHQTGVALINLMGVDLFKFINTELENSDGKDWLTNYRKSNLVYASYNFIDPSNLLKELLRVSTSPLRKPIKSLIEPKDSVAFFNRLQIILDDRNDWVHHNSKFSSEQLKTLILNIYPIGRKLNLGLKLECDFLLSKLDGVIPDIAQIEDSTIPEIESQTSSQLVETLNYVIPKDELTVGTSIDSDFLEYSYVLHLTGQIQRYMGYVKDELCEDGQTVKGLIIGIEDDNKLRRALSVTTGIDFYRYIVDFKLVKGFSE